MARVPTVDSICFRLECACRDKRIVNSATRDVLGCCILDGRECGGSVKADKPESGRDLFDAFDGLLWRRPMRRRNASQGRVNLGKAVCGTTRGAWFAIRKQGNAGGVMGMVREEYRNQNRRIEEAGHLSAARTPRDPVLAESCRSCRQPPRDRVAAQCEGRVFPVPQ